MLKFHVGALLHKPQGALERFDITESHHFESAEELNLTKPVTGRVQLLKLPQEINVQISDLETTAEFQCSRCLSNFSRNIKMPLISREFIIDLPQRDLEEGEEVNYVNKNTNEIELDDMVREELLLHFPEFPLCSKSCKGLCDRCGANRNEKTCSCTRIESSNVPFKLPYG